MGAVNKQQSFTVSEPPIEERPTYGEIDFMGQQFFCDHEGAMYWPDKDCLIVSDLHLEKGAALASRGSLIPPYDTGATLLRLAKCLDHWQPKTVICLGDSFHREDSAYHLPACYHHQLKALMENRKWIWIAGNHDPHPPAVLGGINLEEIAIGSMIFRHEQVFSRGQADLFENLNGEISGHLHPVAIIRRQAKRMRRRCFASDQRRLIMPAFGAFTGGLSVLGKAFSGLLDRHKLHVWMLGNQRVYKISGAQLSR